MSKWSTRVFRLSRSKVFVVAFVSVLVTLAVVIGAMNFITPQKKLQHLPDHRYATTDAEFQREMAVLLGPSIAEGNRITALQNGDEIFPALLEAIHGAQKTITFETFIYWSGDIGGKVAEALCERVRAGVEVHVLVDWVGSSKMDETLLDKMVGAGVDVRKYRPLSWYHLGRMNNRTHRKLLVIDGKLAFTGGVGIADPWTGNAQDPEHFRDVHFRVEGPVVAQLQAAFNDNWVKTSGRVLNGEAYFPPLEAVGDMKSQLFVASPAGGAESMHLMYLLAIAAATKSIDLEAAYFVPDDLIVRALLEARRRGVAIRVLVPGEHIDSQAVRLASRAGWEPLIRAGIEISEYQPTMLHNKVLIVDRLVVSVGSTNFDMRSFRLNDEASLNVYDEGFATHMTEVFEADLKKSKKYTLERWQERPFSEKFLETFVVPFRSQL